MILFNILVLSLAALATADGKAKDKRGIVDYNIPSKYSGSSIYSKSPEDGATYSKPFRSFQGSVDSVPAYTKSIQALLQKSGPVLPPKEYQQYYQQYQQQPQQQVETQAVAYSAPSAAPVGKYSSAGAGLDKYAYLSQPQKAQYSSAAEVSSFSYSSPVVAYNNHGLLQQLAGKSTTPSHGSPITYSSGSSPKSQYQSSPKFQYVSAPAAQQSYSSSYPSAQGLSSSKGAYSSPGTYSGGGGAAAYSGGSAGAYSGGSTAYSASPSGFSSSPSAYSSSPNAYSQQPQASSYEDASNTYQQISQKSLFTAAPVQEQQQVYQSGPQSPQKFSFDQSQYQTQYQSQYQPQKGSAQIDYSAQEYSGAPQATAASSYGGDDQSFAQFFSSEQTVPQQQQQQQQQYYNAGPQQKYTKSGVTYA